MKVLISGYYGYNNVGDEAVLQAIVQGLRQHDQQIGITVLSARPERTQAALDVSAVSRFDLVSIIFRLLGAQAIISGGGTLFQNSTSKLSFFYYIGLVLLAKLLFKKVVIFGQGFGPLKGSFSRLIAKLVLNRVDLITVRDNNAYQEISQLGVNKPKIEVTADPSFILTKPTNESSEKLLIGLALRDFSDKQTPKLTQTLSEVISWLTEQYNGFPILLPFHFPNDQLATAKLGRSAIQRACEPAEMLALIANCDLVIGMRLHSLIFACMTATPMIGLAYDPKVTAFMQTIGQPCFDIKKDLAPDVLKRTIKNLLDNRAKIKTQLEQKDEQLCSQAAKNFDLFFEVIK